MAVENRANIIFEGSTERLAQRMAVGTKTTLRDAAVGLASDAERAARMMFDHTYDVYAKNYREGGIYFWTPTIAKRLWRNFVRPEGGNN